MSHELERLEIAALVHEELDLLADKFTPLPDESGRLEGDYTKPLDRSQRDLALSDLSTATDGQKNAVIAGVTYYMYRRIVNYRSVNVSIAGGIGAGGRRDMNWNLHLRELKQLQKQYREDYEKAAAMIGVILKPVARAAQGTLRIDDEGVGANLVQGIGIGLPWFTEGYNEADDEWHS
jgi:hypothetical protein